MMNTVAAHFNNEHHVPGHEECICPRGGSLYLKMPSMISMVGFQVFYNPSIGILALTSEGYLKKKKISHVDRSIRQVLHPLSASCRVSHLVDAL